MVSAATVAALSAAACVDTQGVLDDYLSRSQAERDKSKATAADASFDAPTNSGGFSGIFIMRCLTPLVGGDTDKLLNFRADVRYEASAERAGVLSISLQALPVKTVLASAAMGNKYPADGSFAKADVKDGKFTLNLGDSPDFPPQANPLNRPEMWGINGLSLGGYLTNPPKAFCANFLAGATRPISFDATGTVCRFDAVADENTPPDTDKPDDSQTSTDGTGDKGPTKGLTADDFHCP